MTPVLRENTSISFYLTSAELSFFFWWGYTEAKMMKVSKTDPKSTSELQVCVYVCVNSFFICFYFYADLCNTHSKLFTYPESGGFFCNGGALNSHSAH